MKILFIKKKSQAALEFLTTYAWAFLVILIMIGALAYFGVLRPSKLLPDRCNFGSELSCINYKIAENGLQLKLRNNAGSIIIIDTITASARKGELSCVSSLTDVWEPGEVKDVSIVCGGVSNIGLVTGDKGKLNLEIKYHEAMSSSYSKSVQGEVFGLVGGSVSINGLVGYWTFDTEGQAEDSSGNGNDGTVLGATWQDTNCRNGGCYDFDGSDSYINVLDDDILDFKADESFTVSVWIYFDEDLTYSPVFVDKRA